MLQRKGRFIVIYGVNNSGKSTVIQLLITMLGKIGIHAIHRKYPAYDMPITGPIINNYFRGPNRNCFNLGPDALQTLQVVNRLQYEPELRRIVNCDGWVIGEDYDDTSIAWGTAQGISKEYLTKINSDLIKEDLAFLLDGERFREGIEEDHLFENNDDLTKEAARQHCILAQEKGWHVINQNQKPEKVASDIWNIIQDKLFINVDRVLKERLDKML